MILRVPWILTFALSVAAIGCGEDDLDAASGAGGSTSSAAGGLSSSVGGTGGSTPGSCYTGSIESVDNNGATIATTPHYELYSEIDDPQTETIARMLEASWQAFGDYFHIDPILAAGQKQRVKLFVDYDSWQAGMIADGIVNPPTNAGGYFDPGTRAAYLYQQPTQYYTRVLVLHEAAHQFHLLGRAKGHSPPSWYVEGIAEHISRHDWDGSCVRLGALPLLSQEDAPAAALESVQVNGLDLESMVNGQGFERPIAMAVTRYFETAEEGALAENHQEFEDAVDIDGVDAATAFNNFLGMPSSYDAPIEEWLKNEQEPMSVVFLEWTHVSSTSIRGRAAGVLTVARLKKPTQHFEARFAAPGEGGLLIAYENANKYVAVILRKSGKVEKFSYLGDSPLWLSTTMSVPQASDYHMSFQRVDNDTITLTVNDSSADIDHGPAAAAGGLALHDGDILFRGIAWE